MSSVIFASDSALFGFGNWDLGFDWDLVPWSLGFARARSPPRFFLLVGYHADSQPRRLAVVEIDAKVEIATKAT